MCGYAIINSQWIKESPSIHDASGQTLWADYLKTPVLKCNKSWLCVTIISNCTVFAKAFVNISSFAKWGENHNNLPSSLSPFSCHISLTEWFRFFPIGRKNRRVSLLPFSIPHLFSKCDRFYNYNYLSFLNSKYRFDIIML